MIYMFFLYLIRGLLSNKYIRKCVEMSDSTQLEKRKRIQSASTTVSDAGEIYCNNPKLLDRLVQTNSEDPGQTVPS